jgi:hypothetical protein
MTLTLQICGATALLCLAANASAAAGQPTPRASDEADASVEFHSVKILDGTDPAFEAAVRQQLKESEGYQRERARDIAQVNYERRSMKQQGYIVADDATVNVHADMITSPHLVPPSDIENRLGFEPAAFHLGLEVIGVLCDPADDGSVHDLTTVLVHPVLGTIRIRERSLATEPRGRMAKYLYGPRFDLKVNGFPALLTVYRSEDGKSGRSDLTVLTDTKLYTVGAGSALLPEDPRYPVLFDVAAAL